MYSSEKGFFLVDVIMAATLITLAVTALGTSFITSLRSSQYVTDSVVAGYLAQQKLEQLKSAASFSELRDAVEPPILLNHQKFERQTIVSAHPVYPSLTVVTVTVSWWLPSRQQRVSNSTYILPSDSALHP